MTAPTPEKIQRWSPALDVGADMEFTSVLRAMDLGSSVLYADHLRHLKLAQIEVLEEMRSRLGGYSKSVDGYCEAKIAALRKEIEG